MGLRRRILIALAVVGVPGCALVAIALVEAKRLGDDDRRRSQAAWSASEARARAEEARERAALAHFGPIVSPLVRTIDAISGAWTERSFTRPLLLWDLTVGDSARTPGVSVHAGFGTSAQFVTHISEDRQAKVPCDRFVLIAIRRRGEEERVRTFTDRTLVRTMKVRESWVEVAGVLVPEGTPLGVRRFEAPEPLPGETAGSASSETDWHVFGRGPEGPLWGWLDSLRVSTDGPVPR